MADKLNPRNARERAQRLAEAEKVGAAAQRTLGVDLPQDVKEFLAVQGGQRPKSGWFTAKKCNSPFRLCGIGGGELVWAGETGRSSSRPPQAAPSVLKTLNGSRTAFLTDDLASH